MAKEERNLPPAWLESLCLSAGRFLGKLCFRSVGTNLSLLNESFSGYLSSTLCMSFTRNTVQTYVIVCLMG